MDTPQYLFHATMTEAARKQGFRFETVVGRISVCKTDMGEIFFYDNMPPSTSLAAHDCCNDRWVSKQLLEAAGLPTPEGKLFREREFQAAWTWMEKLNAPVAVKAYHRFLRQGVTLEAGNREELERAWAYAGRFSKQILVERMVTGLDYRLLLLDHQVLAATLRNRENRDVTGLLHPGFREIAGRLCRVFPPSGHLAIRLKARDIAAAPELQEWSILGVDANPKPHHLSLARGLMDLNYRKLREKRAREREEPLENIAPVWDQEATNYTKGRLKWTMLFRAARERNLKVTEMARRLWFIEDDYGTRRYFSMVMADATSTVAQRMSFLKFLTGRQMEKLGFSVPRSSAFFRNEAEAAWAFARTLPAAVVKPYGGSFGVGVYVNIREKSRFMEAVSRQQVNRFIVEEFVEGNDYRLLVIDGKFVAAIRRTPAYVTGDGIHTLEELIALKNREREANPHTANKPIAPEPEEKGIPLQTVLKAGERLFVRQVANIKAGGESEDVTDQVHPGFRHIAARIVRAMPDLFIGGLDILAPDIGKDPEQQKWALLEINANPGYHMHHFPLKGPKRDVAGVYLDALFPNARREALATPPKSLTVVLQGRVQGIGYRKWIREQAYLFAVDGWVRNVDGNKVELTARGMPNALFHFIEYCVFRHPEARVDTVGKQPWFGPLERGFAIKPDLKSFKGER